MNRGPLPAFYLASTLAVLLPVHVGDDGGRHEVLYRALLLADIVGGVPDLQRHAASGVANFDQEQAYGLVGEWIRSGVRFDAVAANNDEMALGAIRALKEAKIDMAKVIVGGLDATVEGLAAMKAGDLDVTVFQDAAGQGGGAVDLALRLVRKEPVEQKTWVPFELVTPDKADSYLGRN